MFENEEWREIDDFPLYRVSNYGRVKHHDQENARKISVNDRGFPFVVLFGKGGGESKTRYLRQINNLVADAFLPPPLYSDQNYVWHVDGDLTNCRTDNLRWDTRGRVLEWNDMHRRGKPKYVTYRVRNNRTGATFENAYEAAMADGLLESEVIWRIERQARHMHDEAARYMYLED